MERLVTYRHNAGLGEVIRALLVLVGLGVLTIWMAVEMDDPWPLASYAVSPIVPTLIRRSIARNPVVWYYVVGVWALLLLGISALGGFAWNAIDPPPWGFTAFVSGICFLGGAYLATHFWLFSDPDFVEPDDED